MITGRTYLEHGKPVVVLARWTGDDRPAGRPGPHAGVIWYRPCGRGKYKQAPRNVLIRRRGGGSAVRPFRGLFRAPGSA